MSSLLVFGVSLLMIGCTADSNEATDSPTSQPADSTDTSNSSTSAQDDGEQTSDSADAADPDTSADLGSAGEPSAEVEVVLAEEEGISEEPAEEPIVADDEVVELEFEEANEAAQVKVGVSESALCATLQIGRDAVVDGDDDLADGQRDLIIERAARVEDGELATILAKLDADQPLDLAIADDGLRRCQALGFEL